MKRLIIKLIRRLVIKFLERSKKRLLKMASETCCSFDGDQEEEMRIAKARLDLMNRALVFEHAVREILIEQAIEDYSHALTEAAR